jgi:hypothetical protein
MGTARPARRAVIDLLIVVYALGVTLWSLPPQWSVPSLTRLMAPAFFGGGLWQFWLMFAPDPLSTQFDLDATVTFRDGGHAVWVFPRMQELGYAERYRRERYRKWRDAVRLGRPAVVLEDAARYVARLHHHDPANPPVRVVLVRHSARIPPPAPGQHQPLGRTLPPLDRHEALLAYDVRPGDLP